MGRAKLELPIPFASCGQPEFGIGSPVGHCRSLTWAVNTSPFGCVRRRSPALLHVANLNDDDQAWLERQLVEYKDSWSTYGSIEVLDAAAGRRPQCAHPHPRGVVSDPNDLDRLEKTLGSIVGVGGPIEAAGLLAFRISRAQAFAEGNKRTALLLAKSILDYNGFADRFVILSDDRVLADLLVKAPSGSMSRPTSSTCSSFELVTTHSS